MSSLHAGLNSNTFTPLNTQNYKFSSNIMITTTTTKVITREETISKFIREYIYKICQIIIQSRRVAPKHSIELTSSWNDLKGDYSKWFSIEMIDNIQVHTYIEDNCIANWDPIISDFSLTIDISLSAESLKNHVLLERWKINFRKNRNRNTSNNNPSMIYKRMSIQIRSLFCYLRLLPTHQIVKLWDTMNHNDINHNIEAFALYPTYYNDNTKHDISVSSFEDGQIENYCFKSIPTILGSIRTTVFYAANIMQDYQWLIRHVPGMCVISLHVFFILLFFRTKSTIA